MNVVNVDRRTLLRTMVRDRHVGRRRVVRRLVVLPGTSRMRRPDLEPTRLGLGSDNTPIDIVDRPLDTRWEVFRVAGAFLGLTLRLAWLRVCGKARPARSGRELREVFERLGGLWMKVGQLMSLRRDVLPRELCDELAQLQDRAIGFPPEQAMRIIARELGAPIDRIFSAFDPMPFAAASLSQVHAARLRDGNDVVVKVMRPGVREKFERDMRILRFIAERVKQLPSLRQVRLKDALGEFEQIFREETDYRYEIENMRELRKTTRGHNIYIPKVYRKLSTRHVIVMERVTGALMSDFIRIRARDPARVAEWLKTNDIDTEVVGKRLLVSFMRQLFENNLFHADLHPGNIILLRNSRVALIDMGSVGSLDREFLVLYRAVQRALAEKNYGKAADMQMRLCAQLPRGNLTELRMELSRCLRIWSTKTKIKQLPFQERSVNTGAAEVSRILYRYGAQQTWEFLKIARTLSTLDASLEYLYSGLNYIGILQAYFKQASRRAMAQAMRPGTLVRGVGAMAATVDELGIIFGPAIASSAFSFEATVSKVSRVFALVMRLFWVALLLVMLGYVYKFLEEHRGHVAHGLRIDPFDHLVAALPDLDVVWWVVMIVGCLVVLAVLRRILRELLRPEPVGRRS